MSVLPTSVRSVGTRGTSAPGIPGTTLAGDTIACVVEGNITVSGGGPAVAGFTLKNLFTVAATTGRYIAYFEKRLSAPEGAGSYAVTGTNATISYAQAFALVNIANPSTPSVGVKANIASGNNAVLPSTAGVGVGDLSLAAYSSTGSTNTATPASGWTEQSTATAAIGHVFAQVSDGSDRAGDTFVSSAGLAGGIVAFVSFPAANSAPPALGMRSKGADSTVVQPTLAYKGSDGVVVTPSAYFKASDGSVVAL